MMSRCMCKAYQSGGLGSKWFVEQCSRCEKRDELWPELVEALSSMWMEGLVCTKSRIDIDALLSRAKEVS